MSTVQVYCDESGTMPTADNDDIFVAVAVALPQATSPPPRGRASADETLQLLRTFQACAQCRYVQATPGYAAKLARKRLANKYTVRALAAIKEPHPWFASEKEVNPGNMVWYYVLDQAILGALFDVIAARDIMLNRLEVYIDNKSLAARFEHQANATIANVAATIRTHLQNAAHVRALPVRKQRFWFSKSLNLLLRPEDVSVQIAGSAPFRGYRSGLDLADSLSHHVRNALLKNDRKYLADLKAVTGRTVVENITNTILRPLPSNEMQSLEQRSGIPIPQTLRD
jgi:hypothetical protein